MAWSPRCPPPSCQQPLMTRDGVDVENFSGLAAAGTFAGMEPAVSIAANAAGTANGALARSRGIAAASAAVAAKTSRRESSAGAAGGSSLDALTTTAWPRRAARGGLRERRSARPSVVVVDDVAVGGAVKLDIDRAIVDSATARRVGRAGTRFPRSRSREGSTTATTNLCNSRASGACARACGQSPAWAMDKRRKSARRA